MSGDPSAAQDRLRAALRELGFDAVRFAAIGPDAVNPADTRSLRQWLDAGFHGEMQWMERSYEKRVAAEKVLPGAKSVILLGVNYWRGEFAQVSPADAPIWARYARHEDYHDTIKPALVQAGRLLEASYGIAETDYRYYVDAGPVIERGWAARAGVGFIGKNAMLISREFGNWLFLAAIVTRVALTADEPVRQSAEPLPPVGALCGKCSRCLDACPTRAFVRPGVVDARRCISYQTIENKGVIPRELRPGIGARIYGCDVCLEVCPWNRFAQEGRRALLVARDAFADLALADVLRLTPERFAEVFRRTPIKRTKLGGLLRNACVVAGNLGDPTLLPVLVELAGSHPLPLVRAHAVWAVYRLGGGAQLAAARANERDPAVLSEYAAEAADAPGALSS